MNLEKLLKIISLVGPMEIKSRFGIENLFNKSEQNENFTSLMYYLGLLTIKAIRGNKVLLGIPNYSVKTMYWEYLYNTYQVGSFKNMNRISMAMEKDEERC
jgi:hypothetical protein